MSGLGKQMRGSGIAKIQNQSTPFEEGGRAGYVQGGGAKVGDVKVKIPPYLKKGMVKMGFKKGGSTKPGLWANINRRKKLGISRPKSKSTISAKAYANMKAGFPKKKK